MAPKTLPPRDLVCQLLHYDPDTGDFTWLPRPREMFGSDNAFRTWNSRYVEKPAGCVKTIGYRVIAINHVQYYAHRLAWLYAYGPPVPDGIDHREGKNNRIANLRAATQGQNMSNILARKDSRTGVKGVTRHGRGFKAIIRHDKHRTYLGTFDTLEEAAAAWRDAAATLHGEFARWE